VGGDYRVASRAVRICGDMFVLTGFLRVGLSQCVGCSLVWGRDWSEGVLSFKGG
jgi:hypothetical protein